MNSGWAAWAEETVAIDCGESAAAMDFQLWPERRQKTLLTIRFMRCLLQNIFAGIDGGPSGVSHMYRHGNEDPICTSGNVIVNQ